MSPNDIAKYAKVCRKLGIKTLHLDGVKVSIEMGDKPEKQSSTSNESTQELGTSPEVSPEDMLFWSSQET